jgi:hypothetical protein
MLTGLLILALLAPGAFASLAQQAASPVAGPSSTSSGSVLIVENAGQWPAAARFQVWGSPAGVGTTWLAEDAIWIVVASGKLQVARSPGAKPSGGSEAPARSVCRSRAPRSRLWRMVRCAWQSAVSRCS